MDKSCPRADTIPLLKSRVSYNTLSHLCGLNIKHKLHFNDLCDRAFIVELTQITKDEMNFYELQIF